MQTSNEINELAAALSIAQGDGSCCSKEELKPVHFKSHSLT
jgi:hypothetical protein